MPASRGGVDAGAPARTANDPAEADPSRRTAGHPTGAGSSPPAAGPVDARASGHARLRPLALGEATITGGLWADRQRLNHEVLIPGAVEHLEGAGNFDNLRAAAGAKRAPFSGPVFMDSDVYKWLEALGWELGRAPDERLAKMADGAIELVEAAQEPDGYLNSRYQVDPPGQRFSNLAEDHELYCAGHLIQAAVAQARGSADGRLLAVARRFADLIERTFSGSDRPGTPGHPEIEMALVELARHTGERRYGDLARYFVDQRGRGLLGPGHYGASYHQDHAPVREATEVRGHAVRAMYLAAGVTDLYLEDGERQLLEVMEAQWRDMTAGKTYITGGLGAHHQDEAFGDLYELPPDRCYGETCAAIASIMWNWRMLLATGEPQYADLAERTLHNGFLAGLALDGRGFSYVNPLQVRAGHHDPVERGARRQPWYYVACCPPNVMRLLASLQNYLATRTAQGLQIHQYAPAWLAATLNGAPEPVRLEVETEYPWQGVVQVRIEHAPPVPWELALRIPGWAGRPSLAVNGRPAEAPGGPAYARIRRTWQRGDTVVLELPMAPRLLMPHPRLDAVRGCVAIERGPLVYCIEEADQAGVDDLALEAAAPLRAEAMPSLLPGTVAVRARGARRQATGWPADLPYVERDETTLDAAAAGGNPVELVAIPYALWGNRGDGAMRVWIPEAN